MFKTNNIRINGWALMDIRMIKLISIVFFLLYVNDLPNVSDVLYSILFADDTSLFFNGNDLDVIERIVNQEMSKIAGWLLANKLSLNIQKTQYLIYTPSEGNASRQVECINIRINGENVEQVDHIKFLGVILDSKLDWKHHICYISRNISKGICIICKARQFVDRKMLLTLYYTFVYPYLTYCFQCWGNTYTTTLDPLIKLQKRIVHTLIGGI